MQEKSNKKDKLLMTINNLSFLQFEMFCKEFVEKIGLVNVQTNISNKCVFGTGTIELGIVLSYKFTFLAIQDKSEVPLGIISKIRNKMDAQTNKGLIISTGKFSRIIKKQAKQKGEIQIDLIDGKNLEERINNIVTSNTNKSDFVFLEKKDENYIKL